MQTPAVSCDGGVSVVDRSESTRVLQRLPSDLEEGVYLQAEAARLSGLPRAIVRRWLELDRGPGDGHAARKESPISFLDLISLRAVAALRLSGMGFACIRDGAESMRADLGIDHPLACEDLKIDGVDRYFRCGPDPVAVAADVPASAQELVAVSLQDVKYAPVAGGRGLATSWEPSGVSLNPRVQRGAPCVRGTRIQISVLQGFVEAGDPPELLAEMYGLERVQVDEALAWYRRLAQQAA